MEEHENQNNINNINNSENDNYVQKIEHLKQLVENQEQEIEKLKEENEKYKKKDTSFSIQNKKDSSIGGEGRFMSSKMDRLSMGGDGISDEDKIKKLLERIEEFKNESELNKNLIKILKEDIKSLKNKLNEFETFNGKIPNYNEFIRLFNIVLKDYKPNKKAQKEALAQLKNHLKKEVD